MDEEIRIRLKGEGISPGLIRSKEIAEILESVEDMVVAEALKADPTLSKEHIIVSTLNSRGKPTSNQYGLRFLSN
jgi:hypothetical protein